MGKLHIKDDSIWLKHIETDVTAMRRLERLQAGETVRLRIAGVAGTWERMADGKDGRPTPGLKPVGEARDFWRSMQARRNETVDFQIEGQPDTYLENIAVLMSEWESEEDERAFRDL